MLGPCRRHLLAAHLTSAAAGSIYVVHAPTSTAAKPVAAVARPATDVLSTGLPSSPARPLLPVAPFSSWTSHQMGVYVPAVSPVVHHGQQDADDSKHMAGLTAMALGR